MGKAEHPNHIQMPSFRRGDVTTLAL